MRFWWLIALTLFSMGCSFSSGGDRCLTDDDCLSGTFCDQEAGCIQGSRDADRMDEADAASLSDLSDSSEDGANLDDGGHSVDMSETTRDMSETTRDMSGSDMSIVDPDMFEIDLGPSTGACVIDPFTVTCSADPFEPNNRVGDSYNIQETSGCTYDEFISSDDRFSAELCRGDEDWFAKNFVQCEQHSILIEAIVTPKVPCAHSDWSLRISGQQCAATNVQCEESQDGSKSVTVIYPAREIPTVRIAQIVVEADTDVKLPYELQVITR